MNARNRRSAARLGRNAAYQKEVTVTAATSRRKGIIPKVPVRKLSIKYGATAVAASVRARKGSWPTCSNRSRTALNPGARKKASSARNAGSTARTIQAGIFCCWE